MENLSYLFIVIIWSSPRLVSRPSNEPVVLGQTQKEGHQKLDPDFVGASICVAESFKHLNSLFNDLNYSE